LHLLIELTVRQKNTLHPRNAGMERKIRHYEHETMAMAMTDLLSV
jgi:hypothetical protein